jgi:hypothetical protein
VPVGINGTTSSFDLAPPVGSFIEKGSVCTSQWEDEVSFQPNCLPLTGIIPLTTCQVLSLLGVEHTLEEEKKKLFIEPPFLLLESCTCSIGKISGEKM